MSRGSPRYTPDSTLNSSVYSLFILALALLLIRVNSLSFIDFAGTLYYTKHLLFHSYIQIQKPV
jgi:hypothetical protein